MARHSFIQMSKLSNVKGRISYITSHAKQENLYATYRTADNEFWSNLARESQQEFKRSGTEGKCIEARELIIALPEVYTRYEPQEVLEDFTEEFRKRYVTCLHLHSEETAAQEFMETKRLMHNEGGRSCYHGYQSFKADEVDADTAHSIGVTLARELWGDRFQVVIATHCNTGHYHNHFVINSVSDVDGKKFYNSPADYRRMREVSDRLCREAKISVIEYPADRRVNYGEWLAEKNGKPTMRSRIREDIDRAILASTTEREFQRVMKEMGYEVITKTPKGSPRVHPIVRIVDGGKNFRLDKLGEYYELDSIKQRIQNNYRRKTPFPEVAEDTKAPYYQYKEKAKKASGLHALYLFEIMTEVKGNQVEMLKIPTDRVRRYFKPETTYRQMEEYIVKALEHYALYLKRQRNRDSR